MYTHSEVDTLDQSFINSWSADYQRSAGIFELSDSIFEVKLFYLCTNKHLILIETSLYYTDFKSHGVVTVDYISLLFQSKFLNYFV